MGYIDLHSHILPGVDDGAKDLEMALEMVRLALADGVEIMVATPHPNQLNGIGSPIVTKQVVAEFNSILLEQGLGNLQVLAGAECFFEPETIEGLTSGQLSTINDSRYVLIEFHPVIAPVNIENMLFRLRSIGYVPIIAHPERYKYVQTDLEWLARLVRQGCLVQLTAGAFYGRFGKNCQKAAELILTQRLVHVVASDTHNTVIRAPGISPARPLIEKLSSPAIFRQLTSEIPAKILADVDYEWLMTESKAVKPFWKFW